MTNLRIGHGFDVHALADGLNLRLGGIDIPHTKGCVAHSDGDVVLHAICDAMLGAVAMGDIGQHFPDTSAEFKGIDSTILLERCVALLAENGYSLVNIDATIQAQAPKLMPHIDAMREVIAQKTGLPKDCVSVKATTTERLGFVGRKEGIAVDAVVLVEKQ